MMAKNKTGTAPTTTARGQRAPKGILRRLLRTLFEFYPVLLPITLVCILINAIVSAAPSIFMQNVIALVDESYQSGDWASVSGRILTYVAILVIMYVISLIAGAFYTQMMAIITQGSLKKLREKMFSHMQDLPIKYFDTNGHGDIMSYYTNDVDTLRQLISQSLPQMTISGITLLVVFCIMTVLQHHSRAAGGCRHHLHDHRMLGPSPVRSTPAISSCASRSTHRAMAEAFMEEMMTGQKVIEGVLPRGWLPRRISTSVNGESFFNSPATANTLRQYSDACAE
ncbi:MAG: ABC transporter transmembrane domain-containing protein [Oscillospiraceae bacterium]